MERIGRFVASEEERAQIGDSVVRRWLSHPEMEHFFSKYGMDETYFRERYAPLFFYRRESDPRDGYNQEDFVDYLQNRDVTLVDLDRLFSTYRRALLGVMIESGFSDGAVIDDILEDTDAQRQKALEYYAHSIYSGKKKLARELVKFRQYQKVIDKSAIVSKTDPRGVLTYVNPAFCTISGYSRDELIGRPHSIVRHPDSRPEQFATLWNTIQAKKVYHGVIKNLRKGGGTYYVDATIVPILDEENQIVEYIALRYDITKLVEALEQARLAQRAKDEFLANISHEIRTPLNAIIGFITILRSRVRDETDAHYLGVIDKSSQTLLSTVNDILDLSKLQSGKFAIVNDPFDPLRELGSVVSLFGLRAHEKEIRYAVYLDPAIPVCLLGDAGRIKQVLANFLSNAIKFTPEKGMVKIKGVYAAGTLTVMVQDTGIGVHPLKQGKIFEAFEQADGSISRNHGGTGLGLSICTQLVSLMEGEILFKSVEHRGSRFGFKIPCPLCPDVQEARFDPLRYASLHGAVLLEEEEGETVLLLEKYLSDFGVGTVAVNPPLLGKWDFAICPPGCAATEELLRRGTEVAMLCRTYGAPGEAAEGVTRLPSPFLPQEIQGVLERALMRRRG